MVRVKQRSMMRATLHNGRVRKADGKAFSAKHNDRNYQHADTRANNEAAASSNITWHLFEEEGVETFDEAEHLYYERTYSEHLEKMNQRYKKSGHNEDAKTIDQIRTSPRYAPEETIFQIGAAEYGEQNLISRETYQQCLMEYIEFLNGWNEEHAVDGITPFTILDWATHEDETIRHTHIRKVWQYKDGEDMWIGQDKALERSGVELPNPDKKKSRFNNRKQTFDEICRQKQLEILESHGIHIDAIPLPSRGKTKRTNEDYINEVYQVELDAARELRKSNEEVVEALDHYKKAAEVVIKKTDTAVHESHEAIIDPKEIRAIEIIVEQNPVDTGVISKKSGEHIFAIRGTEKLFTLLKKFLRRALEAVQIQKRLLPTSAEIERAQSLQKSLEEKILANQKLVDQYKQVEMQAMRKDRAN